MWFWNLLLGVRCGWASHDRVPGRAIETTEKTAEDSVIGVIRRTTSDELSRVSRQGWGIARFALRITLLERIAVEAWPGNILSCHYACTNPPLWVWLGVP